MTLTTVSRLPDAIKDAVVYHAIRAFLRGFCKQSRRHLINAVKVAIRHSLVQDETAAEVIERRAAA